MTLLAVTRKQGGVASVRSPHHETKRARRRRQAQEDEQDPTAPKQTLQSGGSRSRGCADLEEGRRAPGRRPCHCPGRTTANSANTNSKANNMSTPHTHSKKSGNAGWAGQGCRRQSGYKYTIKMWDWDWVLHGRRQGAQLETGRGRSCRNCTLEQTDL